MKKHYWTSTSWGKYIPTGCVYKIATGDVG